MLSERSTWATSGSHNQTHSDRFMAPRKKISFNHRMKNWAWQTRSTKWCLSWRPTRVEMLLPVSWSLPARVALLSSIASIWLLYLHRTAVQVAKSLRKLLLITDLPRPSASWKTCSSPIHRSSNRAQRNASEVTLASIAASHASTASMTLKTASIITETQSDCNLDAIKTLYRPRIKKWCSQSVFQLLSNSTKTVRLSASI